MPAKDSQIEGEAEAQEIIELKELLRARQILLDFQSKVPKIYYYVSAGDFLWNELKTAKDLVIDAKKHNETVATRSRKVLKDLKLYNQRQPMRVRPAPFITAEEEQIIRATLSLEPQLTLLEEHLDIFLELQIQSQSQTRLRYLIVYKLRREFIISLKRLNEIIAVVTELVRLEDDVRRRLG